MNELKKDFFECLNNELSQKGFKFIKTREGFIKKTAFGELWFTFLFYQYNHIEINPLIQIRFNELENIYHETSYFDKRQQKKTSTIGCAVENYLSDKTGKFRKVLYNNNDIFKFYIDLFEEIAEPFFDKYNNIESLDTLINENSEEEIVLVNPIFRGAKGLIISYLLNNDNFSSLSERYEIFYQNFSDGFYYDDFKSVLENLKSKKKKSYIKTT